MKRYDCLRAIAPHFGEELVVTNLGAVRHEWQALRPHHGNYHLQNLGLTSSMALGLALALPHRKVVAFDGDGSLLLNLGSLATIANQHPKNLVHIVFDNECYESSRGAPTATAGQADLAAVARGCGIANVRLRRRSMNSETVSCAPSRVTISISFTQKLKQERATCRRRPWTRRKTNICSSATSRKAKT